MNLDRKLQQIGLTPSETRIYLYLLENGISSPPQMSKDTGIARSNLHYTLQGLFGRDLVKRQKKGKRWVYAPADPSATLRVLDKKREAMEGALSDLRALYKTSTNKPVVKFYEGVEEIKQIYEDILKTKSEEVIAVASTSQLFALMPDYFQTRFQKELKRRGIFLRAILSYASGSKAAPETKRNMHPYYDYKLMDKKYGDLPTDILVWDDSLAVIVLEQPVFGVVLVSKPLSETYRAQFQIMWNALQNV